MAGFANDSATSPSTDALRVLREVRSLSTGRVGYAAIEVNDGVVWARACRVLMRAGSDVQPELEALVATGTPLGRLSAAALIARFDRAAGRHALTRLTADAEQVTYMSGCIMMSARVSEVATRILSSTVLDSTSPPGIVPVPLGDLVYGAIANLITGPLPTEPEPDVEVPAKTREPLLAPPVVVARSGSPALALWLVGAVALVLVLVLLRALQG